MARDDPFVATIRQELEHYPGVKLVLPKGPRGRHRKAVLRAEGKGERFIVLPHSTSDPIRGPKNAVRDVRKELGNLGVERIEAIPKSKREHQQLQASRESKVFDPHMGSSRRALILSIPKTNPLFPRFAAKEHLWRLELRSNPSGGDPFIALVASKPPPGKVRAHGMVGGTWNELNKAWVLNFQDTATRKLVTEKLGEWRSSPIKLRGDSMGTILFEAPPNRRPPILRGKARLEAEEAALEALTRPDVIEPTPEAIKDAAEAEVAKSQIVVQPEVHVTMDPTKPMVLQLPKAAFNLESAIKGINQLKERLGSDLRLTVTEGGFLSVVQKLGVR